MLSTKNNIPLIIGSILLGVILLSITGCNLFISLTEPNSPPVAIVCNDQCVYILEEVKLNGRSSYDPDGDPLTYEWTIVLKPDNSSIQDNDIIQRSSPVASITLRLVGTYKFKLTVSDNEHESNDILTIYVDELEPDPDSTSPPDPDSTRPPDPGHTTPPDVDPTPEPTRTNEPPVETSNTPTPAP